MDQYHLNTQAMEAVRSGDLLLLKSALTAGANPSFQGGASEGLFSLLHEAAARKHWEMVETLCTAGANANAQDLRFRTPLHFVAGHADLASMAAAQILLDHGANPYLCDKRGRSAIDYGSSAQLHKAVAQGDEERATRFYNEGVAWGLSIGDDGPVQPLWRTAFDNGLDALGVRVATERLEEGFSGWNAADSNGDTPLTYAARQGRPKLCQALIDAGYGVNATRDMCDSDTPYNVASNQACREVLLKNGASPHCVTQLHIAALEGNMGLAHQLVAEGADINAVNQLGETPLHWVAASRPVDEFIDWGAHVNARDCNGCTPLHNAIAHRNYAAANTLLVRGADPTICSAGGRTPLHVVCQSGHDWEEEGIALLHRLISAGCDPNKRDIAGETALFHAADQASPGFAAILMEHGADPRLTNHEGKTALDWADCLKTHDVIAARVNELNLRDALQMSVARQHEQARQGNGRRM